MDKMLVVVRYRNGDTYQGWFYSKDAAESFMRRACESENVVEAVLLEPRMISFGPTSRC